MEEVDCTAHLPHNVLGHPLLYLELAFHFLEKVAIQTGLHQYVGLILVEEEMVKPANVGVIQKRLDFDLSNQVFHLLRTDSVSMDRLDSVKCTTQITSVFTQNY